jgi:two-component system, NarL family, sensor histidine kinase DesK
MFASRAIDACEDPYAAPGAYKGDDAARPWTFRRAVQNMFWIYASGLVFLIFAVVGVAFAPSAAPKIIQFALIFVLAVAYVGSAWVADTTLKFRWMYIAGFVALPALTAPWWGWGFVYYGIYVSIMLATLIPWPQARVAILLWNGLVAVASLLSWDASLIYIALVGVALGLATGAGIQAGRIGARLHRAEQRVSALALAAERERIGRDLHDILGHSLTTISIKTDLAERLVDSDPAAARAQIAEVSAIARQALADVRATASAIREVRVAGELASARSVLLAAGIEASTPTATEPMTDATSELFGYVIREAVTNVVRHSDASHCRITLESRSVTITDNGKGLGPDRSAGSGLTGLRQRVEAVGGTLSVESGAQGCSVRASLPLESHVASPSSGRTVARR